MSEPTRIISLGAGVQSTVMALMAAHGEIQGKVTACVFADTQAEPASVYDHLRWLMSPNVLPFPVHIVSRGNLADDGLQVRTSGKSGKRYQKNIIPLFVKNPDGSGGILNRKCTSEYKVREIIKKTRTIVGAATVRKWRKHGGPPLVEQWIGISTDEASRMKPSREPWITNRWPLIDAGMTRRDCLRWMERNGYAEPPRSACYFCPYHSNIEWRRLRDEEPDDFQRAVDWERRAQAANSKDQAAKGKIFLHSARVPLSEVDFSTEAERSGQGDLFDNECEGICGV